jgi:hypothetical protein
MALGLLPCPLLSDAEPPDEPLASACQAQWKESSGKSQVLFSSMVLNVVRNRVFKGR